MKTIEKWFEPCVIIFSLGMIIVLVFADVIARFAFSTSIAVANELARFCFVYMIYFGVSYAIREKRHMRVTLLLDLIPEKAARWVYAAAEFVFLIYSVAVCWLGVVITQQAFERGKILSSTEWPLGVLYFAIILSGALSVMRLCVSIKCIIFCGYGHNHLKVEG